VCQRLAKLTTFDEEIGDKTLEEMYPQHFRALRDAELLVNKSPRFNEVLSKIEEGKATKLELSKEKGEKANKRIEIGNAQSSSA
jgi:hypothetical protein